MNLRNYDEMKIRVHTLLDKPDREDRAALLIQIIIAMAIVINTIGIVIFTVKPIGERYDYLLNPLIAICIFIFLIEYLLRIWSCTCSRDMKGMIGNRIRYAIHVYQIIDLISITPLLFPFFFPKHLTLLRTFRIVSIFKLGRYSRYLASLDQLKRVLFRKREIFGIMLFFLVFVILFSSTLLYMIEYPVQPDKFSSIPAAMWWAMMTVTTVGYGDIYPVTPLGQFIASIVTLAGVLVLALPSAILAAGFMEEREKRKTPNPDPSTRIAEAELLRRIEDLYEQGVFTEKEVEEYKVLVNLLKGS